MDRGRPRQLSSNKFLQASPGCYHSNIFNAATYVSSYIATVIVFKCSYVCVYVM